MKIDIHTHAAHARHPCLRRASGTHYPDPERLIAMMDAAAIDRAVVMSGVSPECRYTLVTPEETLAMTARYPGRLIPFCCLDPRFLTNDPRADFRPLLAAYRELGCKGIGEYTPNIPLDDPLNMNFFGQVEEAGFPLTFHLAPRQGGFYGCIDEIGLPRLERVLRAFPGLIFLGHSQPFWAEIGTNVLCGDERIRYPRGPVTPGRLVELMRRYPNLHGDLSVSGFSAISRDPEFGVTFMEAFQDRLYWGTDIAYYPQDLPIVPYFDRIRQEGLLSAEAFEKITWRNAARLLNLDAVPAENP